GVSILDAPPRERAHAVGYVGQDPLAGFVTDTVEEELAYGMEQLGLAPETMRRRVEETLDLLGIADLRDRDLKTLSGGQQQRVAIGAVLTMHPRLLVLDEPTAALHPPAPGGGRGAPAPPGCPRPGASGCGGRRPAGGGGRGAPPACAWSAAARWRSAPRRPCWPRRGSSRRWSSWAVRPAGRRCR